jgi:dienelactone hydrolase
VVTSCPSSEGEMSEDVSAGGDPSSRRKASSLTAASWSRPILVARAGLDNAWLNAGTDRFVQTALSAGATLDLLNHPDGRHGFDILDDDDRSKQIIRRTLAFLRDHLAG